MKRFIGKRQLAAEFYLDLDSAIIKRGIVRFKLDGQEIEAAMSHETSIAIEDYFKGGCKKFHKPKLRRNALAGKAVRERSRSL